MAIEMRLRAKYLVGGASKFGGTKRKRENSGGVGRAGRRKRRINGDELAAKLGIVEKLAVEAERHRKARESVTLTPHAEAA